MLSLGKRKSCMWSCKLPKVSFTANFNVHYKRDKSALISETKSTNIFAGSKMDESGCKCTYQAEAVGSLLPT